MLRPWFSLARRHTFRPWDESNRGIQMNQTARGGDTRALDKLGGRAPYRTAAWKALRQVIYGRDAGLCQGCGGQVRGRDWGIRHRRPHHGDPALFWAEGNLELECANCTRTRLRRGPSAWIELDDREAQRA